jgi:predicted oxidoreductase
MKLIEKVKPEILEALEKDVKINYSASYKYIIASLKNVDRYRELSINEVDQLIMFLPQKLRPNDRIDFYYGDYLLKKEYQV